MRDTVLCYAGFLSRFGDGQRASNAIPEAVLLGGSLEVDERYISAFLQHRDMMHHIRKFPTGLGYSWQPGREFPDAVEERRPHGSIRDAMAGSALWICSVDLTDRRDLWGVGIRAYERY